MMMRESNKLRVQCAEARAEVAAFEWADDDSRVTGSVAAWRGAFPAARAVNVSGRADFCDADFAHIRGGPGARLHTVRMRKCGGVTDAAFAHLRGIHTLEMGYCDQAALTDAAFAHLRGIRTLDMTACNQETITDAAFAHLRGIHALEMRLCNQAAITPAAFARLAGIHALDAHACRRAVWAAADALDQRPAATGVAARLLDGLFRALRGGL
jgi:hypothetical protein